MVVTDSLLISQEVSAAAVDTAQRTEGSHLHADTDTFARTVSHVADSTPPQTVREEKGFTIAQPYLYSVESTGEAPQDTLPALDGDKSDASNPTDSIPAMFCGDIAFFEDTAPTLHTSTARLGSSGSPLPYNAGNDNLVSAILIGCILLSLVCLSIARNFFSRQVRSFFHELHSYAPFTTDTSNEIFAALLLMLQTCAQLSILVFLHSGNIIDDNTVFRSQYTFLWIAFAAFTGYFIVKALLYGMVNNIFFDKRKNIRWMKVFILVSATEGVALLPASLLQIYFDVPAENVVLYAAFVIIAAKLLTFYKCFSIFFKHPSGFLQLILYFCALEMVPLLLLWGIMTNIIDCLEVNI